MALENSGDRTTPGSRWTLQIGRLLSLLWTLVAILKIAGVVEVAWVFVGVGFGLSLLIYLVGAAWMASQVDDSKRQ